MTSFYLREFHLGDACGEHADELLSDLYSGPSITAEEYPWCRCDWCDDDDDDDDDDDGWES
jgi:hypothetical protein